MKITKKFVVVSLVGVLVGVSLSTGIRFALFKDDRVHYHANFALYIDGQRDMFDGPGFYEEETACTSSNSDNPHNHVHLHEQNAGLVHVHAHGAMWTDLFTNLGYGLSDKAVTTLSTVYVDGQDGNKLTFDLNGKIVSSISGKLIGSEDVLLINYGKDDQSTIDQRFKAVPRDAHKANSENDPATCSGSQPVTFTTRLKKALGI